MQGVAISRVSRSSSLRRRALALATCMAMTSQALAQTLDQQAASLASQQTVSVVPIDDGDFPVYTMVGSGVPPDPGAAANQTVQGVDSDNDGIRDDVELQIARYYPGNPRARAYSYLLAMNYQQVIETAPGRAQQLARVAEEGYLELCLAALLPNDDLRGTRLVLPWVLNTYDRSLAYLNARRAIGGAVLPTIQDCNP